MFDLGIRLIAAYLIGSLMGALLVGRLSGAGDIRREGSGNAGGTNALRTRGLGFAVAVVLVDIGKGALAATAVASFAAPWPATPISAYTVALLCAGGAVIGHVFPFWYGFRGGKGAATLVGAYAALSPLLILPVLVVWLASLTLSGFVGLSTMLAAGAAAVAVLVLQPGPAPDALFYFALLMALLIVYTHRENVHRMLRGEEDRKRRIMLFGRIRDGS